MHRHHRGLAIAVNVASRSLGDQWNDGSDGYNWKSRNLMEKRALALDYLGDVKKRVPIHDAIRMKSDINRKSLQESGEAISSFFESAEFADDEYALGGGDSVVDELRSVIDLLLMNEVSEDDIGHISAADSELLKDEFFGADTARAKSMKEWLRLRRETAEYQSYASIPESERNNWSAWYLRNVKNDPNSDQ